MVNSALKRKTTRVLQYMRTYVAITRAGIVAHVFEQG
jgi:hypothetical protein